MFKTLSAPLSALLSHLKKQSIQTRNIFICLFVKLFVIIVFELYLVSLNCDFVVVLFSFISLLHSFVIPYLNIRSQALFKKSGIPVLYLFPFNIYNHREAMRTFTCDCIPLYIPF